MNIQVVVSTPGDVHGIRRVQRLTWLKTYPNEKAGITIADIMAVFEKDGTAEGRRNIDKRKERYNNPNIKIWVAKKDREIVGFCSAMIEKKYNRILAIYILPNLQRRGTGQALIKEAFGWFGKDRDIFVNVASYNKKAIAFYRKCGFTETGRSGTLDTAAKLPSGKSIPEIEMVKPADV